MRGDTLPAGPISKASTIFAFSVDPLSKQTQSEQQEKVEKWTTLADNS